MYERLWIIERRSRLDGKWSSYKRWIAQDIHRALKDLEHEVNQDKEWKERYRLRRVQDASE